MPETHNALHQGRHRQTMLFRSICWVIAAILVIPQTTQAERVKDLASIAGVRDNQLLGYGLVVGLDGTGDKTGQVQFTEQSMRSMLSEFGVSIPPGIKISPKNVAAVSVHATMAAFVKPGQRIDVTISSLGNAQSLRGGALLMTPLRGIDGAVYAIAQGEVVVGGFSASGADGSSVQKNIPSAGRIPNGATVEREVANVFAEAGDITLNLHQPDFTTAQRMVDAINNKLGSPLARALDAVSVVVKSPMKLPDKVTFLSVLENIDVKPANSIAKIIVNSRTGTIVIGENVTVMPAAVAHGNLTVTIGEGVNVDQPDTPLAGGQTVATRESNINVDEQGGALQTIPRGVTLNDVVKSLNSVGASTSDLIAILEALKQLGALRGQLIII